MPADQETRGAGRRAAVALGYDGGRDVPRVLAKGYGSTAEQIIEEAGRHGVFVHDTPELVALLMQVDLDQAIPEELYLVVAELLVWLREVEAGQ